ncbi:hypothetical protein R6Q59_018815 [Mikania micrantha]
MSRNQNPGVPSANTRGQKRTHTDANEPVIQKTELKEIIAKEIKDAISTIIAAIKNNENSNPENTVTKAKEVSSSNNENIEASRLLTDGMVRTQEEKKSQEAIQKVDQSSKRPAGKFVKKEGGSGTFPQCKT